VEVPPNASFTPTNFTLEAWVYPTLSTCNTILSRGDGGINSLTDYILDVGYDGNSCGTMTVGFFAAGAWDPSGHYVVLNGWTHVAVTYDGTIKHFYINGVLDSTAVPTNSLYSTPTSPLYIGRQGSVCDCNFFNGQLAEVHIWNTVRTASQIQSDMNYSSGAQPGLVAYYHLNEGSGTTADDASGNGNTGTLQNGASWSSLAPPLGQLVVANIADSGPGTLRAAIADAINGAVITFATNLSGATITLASTLTINTNLTIDASALPGGIQINGNGTVRVLNISSGPAVILNSLTITNGRATPIGLQGLLGGGIYNSNNGTLTLNQCTVSGNSAGSGGGGIYNAGGLTLNQCTVSGNSGDGGGIFNFGALTLNQCTVSGNRAVGNGGGLVNQFSNPLLLNGCTVFGNTNGGIFLNSEAATLQNVIVAGSSGHPDIVGNGTLLIGAINLVQSYTNVLLAV
jgi:hypothetical protein